MNDDPLPTFIIDCPVCKAKVAAVEHGRIDRSGGRDDEAGETHYGISVGLGQCPKCRSILVGESPQVAISGYDARDNEWGEPVRVYPDPPKAFTSTRIPKVVTESISEGLRTLQANANVAACAMFGRALEAICRDLLGSSESRGIPSHAEDSSRRPIMLGEGLRKLKEKELIDQKLLDWSQELRAFRNLAAHPTDDTITREEAEDLRSFVIAIVEYIYDLTDRYNEFKQRLEKKKQE